MKKAVFFDRDGVINQKAKDHEYIKKWHEFKVIPEIIEVMQHVQGKEYKIIIVTNQRGIARGLMTLEDLAEIHTNLQQLLASHNILVTDIFYCPHDIHEHCNCRKPKVGMLIKAQELYHIDFKKSFLVGDSLTDIEAANKLKITSILYSKDTISKTTNPVAKHIVSDLREIKKIIN